MSNGQHRRASRSVIRTATALAASLVVGIVCTSAPGSADPRSTPQPSSRLTISQAQQRLDALDRQGEIASEAYNTARVRMQQAQDRLTGVQADLHRQENRVATLRRQIVTSVLSDYESTGGLSTSAAFLVSRQPGQFINALATSAVVEHQQAGMLARFQQQQNQLGAQQQQASRALAAISADKKELARHKAALDDKIAQAHRLLASLKAQQRQRILARQRAARQAATAQATRSATRPPTSPPAGAPAQTQQTQAPSSPAPAPPASGRAAIAVQTALAQVGDPYVYGAAGPDAFDCSGLTMYAWAAAGVALSHSAAVQASQGVPVSLSALQPGDLIFYYSPISHVAMYIGNGMVVHAPHTGSVVQVVPMNSMPIAAATRVG